MALSEDLLSEHSEHLNDYKVACEQHPELKSFDSALQERTTKAIGDLTDESENKPVSPYAAHKVISQHVIDVTEGVTKFITEGDYNFGESEALKSLVKAYFESTKKTLDILDTIEKCVEEAEKGQLYIREAVIEFKAESTKKDVGGKKKKYEKTLESLNKFKATGDPFSGKVLKTQFELIFEQQKTLLNAVKETKEKLKDEIDGLEKAAKITTAVCGVAVAGLIIGGLVLMATGVGAFWGVGMVLGGMAVAAGWAIAYSILHNKIEALEKRLEHLKELDKLADGIEKDILLEKLGMETISTQVNRLERHIQDVLNLSYTATEDEDNEAKTRLYLEEICGKAEKLTKEIKEVGESVEDHINLISKARLRVMQKTSG